MMDGFPPRHVGVHYKSARIFHFPDLPPPPLEKTTSPSIPWTSPTLSSLSLPSAPTLSPLHPTHCQASPSPPPRPTARRTPRLSSPRRSRSTAAGPASPWALPSTRRRAWPTTPPGPGASNSGGRAAAGIVYGEESLCDEIVLKFLFEHSAVRLERGR